MHLTLAMVAFLNKGFFYKEHVVAYTSKHWNPAQQKYSTIKKEVLAIVLCISKFQYDLLNQKFFNKS